MQTVMIIDFLLCSATKVVFLHGSENPQP